MQWHRSPGAGLPLRQAPVPLESMAYACLPLSTRCVLQKLLDCAPVRQGLHSPPSRDSIVPAALPSPRPHLSSDARKLREFESATLTRPSHHNANAALCSTEPQAETVSALEQQLASGAPLVCVLGQQPGPSRQLAYLKAVLSTLLGNANTSSSSASATSAASAPPAIQGHTSGLQATLPHAAASPLAGDGSVAPVWKPRQHQHWQRALQPHVRAIVICPSQQAAFQAHELAFDLARHVQGRQRVKVQLVHGGEPLARDVSMLREQCPDVLVSTPGRLMDILTQGSKARLDYLLGAVELVVVDGGEQLLGLPALRHQCESILRGLRTTAMQAQNRRPVSTTSVTQSSSIAAGTSQEGGVQLLLTTTTLALEPGMAQHVEACVRLLSSCSSEAAAAAVQAAVGACPTPVLLQQQLAHQKDDVRMTASPSHDDELQSTFPHLQRQAQVSAPAASSSLLLAQPRTPTQLHHTPVQALPVAGSHLLSQLYLTLRSHAEGRYTARLPAARVLVMVPSAWVATVWARGLKAAGVPTVEVHGGRSPELRSMALQVFNLPPAPPAVADAAAGPNQRGSAQSRPAHAIASGSMPASTSSSSSSGITGLPLGSDGMPSSSAVTNSTGTPETDGAADVNSSSDVAGRGPFTGSLVMLATPGALAGVALQHLSLVVQVGLPRYLLHLQEVVTHASHIANRRSQPSPAPTTSAQSPASGPSAPQLHSLPAGQAALFVPTKAQLQRPGVGAAGQMSSPQDPAGASREHDTCRGLVMLLTQEEAQAGLPALENALSSIPAPSSQAPIGESSTPPAPPAVTRLHASSPQMLRAAYHHLHRAMSRGAGVPAPVKLRAWVSLMNTYLDHPLAPMDVATWRQLALSLAQCMRLVQPGPHPVPAAVVHRWGPERCQGLVTAASPGNTQVPTHNAAAGSAAPSQRHHQQQGQQEETHQGTLADISAGGKALQHQQHGQGGQQQLYLYYRRLQQIRKQFKLQKQYRQVVHKMLGYRAQSRRDYLMRLWEAQEELARAAPRGSVPLDSTTTGGKKRSLRRRNRRSPSVPGSLPSTGGAMSLKDGAQPAQSAAAATAAVTKQKRQGVLQKTTEVANKQGSKQHREESTSQGAKEAGRRPLFPAEHLQSPPVGRGTAGPSPASDGGDDQLAAGSRGVRRRLWRPANQNQQG